MLLFAEAGQEWWRAASIAAFLSLPLTKVFFFGFIGSCAIELANILKRHEGSGKFPVRYQKVSFWVARLLFSYVAGMLATLFTSDNNLLAFNVGAAAPLILQQIASRAPESN